MRGFAVTVERQLERIALLLARRILHHGVETLVLRIRNGNSELEFLVREIRSRVPLRHLQLLRHR